MKKTILERPRAYDTSNLLSEHQMLLKSQKFLGLLYTESILKVPSSDEEQ